MRLFPIFSFRDRCALFAAAIALLTAGGCRSFDPPAELTGLGDDARKSASAELASSGQKTTAVVAGAEADSISATNETTEPEDEPAPSRPPAPTSDADADAILVLLEDNWSAESEVATGAPYRWRHPGLDELVEAPVAERADLSKFLTSDDPVVAANAAILLARANDSVADVYLVDAVRDATLKLSTRCAAAEALSRPDSVLASIAVAELIEDYGNSKAEQYSPELHAELLRSLARQVDAGESPQLAAGLKNASTVVRLAAIESFASDRQGELPAELIAMRADPQPQVRSAVLTCLVTKHHAQAQEYCLAALGDVHLNVQLAGIAGLGTIGGETSCRALGRLAHHDSEGVRVAAITALAEVGDDVAVFAAAKDPSWHVRRTVAHLLTQFASERGTGVARQLLADSNAEVRHGVIEAVGCWSLPQAGPILLTAMADAPQPTREQAAEQLTRLWPPAAHFAPDAPTDLRQDQIKQLQTAWAGVVDGTTATR